MRTETENDEILNILLQVVIDKLGHKMEELVTGALTITRCTMVISALVYEN